MFRRIREIICMFKEQDDEIERLKKEFHKEVETISTAHDTNVKLLLERIKQMTAVLERLARLGNEPEYGNSIGNQIARAALHTIEPNKEK